jgi:hydroxyethylthiazole kinase
VTANEIGKKTGEILASIREKKPLIHHITNYVVMNSTANVTLAIGASPIMAHSHKEMEEMAGFAGALNLNIGTLDEYWIESMLIAGRTAGKRGIPIILDPVGAGATKQRSDAVRKILDEVPVTVIRGNASEIKAVAGDSFKIKGVDSMESVEAAREGAKRFAKEINKVIAITGKIDFITDGVHSYECHNGHPMFSNVTGTGCAATTAISCFNAVEKDALIATACALGYFGYAGEVAASKSAGPGTFQAALYDALYNISPKTIGDGIKINPA